MLSKREESGKENTLSHTLLRSSRPMYRPSMRPLHCSEESGKENTLSRTLLRSSRPMYRPSMRLGDYTAVNSCPRQLVPASNAGVRVHSEYELCWVRVDHRHKFTGKVCVTSHSIRPPMNNVIGQMPVCIAFFDDGFFVAGDL